MLITHYGLSQLGGALLPRELRCTVDESPILHAIEVIEPVYVGDHRFDQRSKVVARQRLLAQLLRKTRSGMAQCCNGHASKEIVQKFEFESAPDGLRHHGNPSIGKQ